MKRNIALILSFIIGFYLVPPLGGMASGLLKWEERESFYKEMGLEWQFRPRPNQISQQNPPDFSWPKISGAIKYHLKICQDQAMEIVLYEKKDIPVNYYNFPMTFSSGVYYWSVKFFTPNGESEWTPASYFTIRPDATVFTVGETNTLLAKIPEDHPRLGITRAILPEIRTYKTGSQAYVYTMIKEELTKYLNEDVPPEPINRPEEYANLRTHVASMLNRITRAGLIFLVEEEEAAGKLGVDTLMALANWDAYGATAYENNDQAFRDVIYGLTIGYDYLYELLTEEQRQTVIQATKLRCGILEKPIKGLQDSAIKVQEAPFQSHGWTAVAYLLSAWIVFYGDFPEAEIGLKQYLPLYLNLLPPWGGEDGGWSQGTGYAAASLPMSEDLRYTLKITGMADVYQKAFYQNIPKFILYNIGKITGNEFGDQSTGAADSSWQMVLQSLSKVGRSSYARWMFETLGIGRSGGIVNYYIGGLQPPPFKTPNDLPNAAYFSDIGWVSMHSDVSDLNNRISLFFKSSPYGSYNHSHSDQNTFTISAYGERLAIDSGYYDSYGSDYYKKYYNQTFAHNGITLNGGEGQGYNTMKAKGKITNFITHPDFDLATGDATEAYQYQTDSLGYVFSDKKLSSAKRHMIYLRPNHIIVIDDLKAHDNQKHTFEWWLNGLNNLTLTENEAGAKILQGKAALSMKIQYPTVKKASFSPVFSKPNGEVLTPGGSFEQLPPHQRVWFSFEEASQTKIITTMEVHSSQNNPSDIQTESFPGYIKCTYSDGTIAYINTGEQESILIDGYLLHGAALILREDSLLAVEVTKLQDGETLLFQSEKPASFALGKTQLSVSSCEETTLSVYLNREVSLTRKDGTPISMNTEKFGYSWEQKNGFLKLKTRGELYESFQILEPSLPDQINSVDQIFLSRDPFLNQSGKLVNALSFISFAKAPESFLGYTRKEYGLLLCEKALSREEFVLENKEVFPAPGIVPPNSQGSFGIRFYGNKIKSGGTYYALAYAVYQDQTGSEVVRYGDQILTVRP